MSCCDMNKNQVNFIGNVFGRILPKPDPVGFCCNNMLNAGRTLEDKIFYRKTFKDGEFKVQINRCLQEDAPDLASISASSPWYVVSVRTLKQRVNATTVELKKNDCDVCGCPKPSFFTYKLLFEVPVMMTVRCHKHLFDVLGTLFVKKSIDTAIPPQCVQDYEFALYAALKASPDKPIHHGWFEACFCGVGNIYVLKEEPSKQSPRFHGCIDPCDPCQAPLFCPVQTLTL